MQIRAAFSILCNFFIFHFRALRQIGSRMNEMQQHADNLLHVTENHTDYLVSTAVQALELDVQEVFENLLYHGYAAVESFEIVNMRCR